MNRRHRDLIGDLAIGAAAGLLAAAATSLFQAAWSRAQLPPTDKPPAEPPPTEVLADDLTKAATGEALAAADRPLAGHLVHYGVGAALGGTYAVARRLDTRIAIGGGVLYGLLVWAVVEETGLALFHLKSPPWRVKPAEHAFAFASHVVFGLTLETALNRLSDHYFLSSQQERYR